VLGEPLPIGAVGEHVFGLALVNDWSARDLQAWEYQPLGPFLGKSFATSIAAWITPLSALAAARVEPPRQDPPVLPYLRSDEPWALDLELEVGLRSAAMAGADVISRGGFAGMYWTVAQQLAHATVNGASLRTGDLFASGTVSGPERGTEGSLLELTLAGREPLTLSDGTPRAFLADGDEVILRGRTARGPLITLAEVTGTVTPRHAALFGAAQGRSELKVSISARPVLPFSSTKGWMVSNWAWAIAACATAGSESSSANVHRSASSSSAASGGGGTNTADHGLKLLPLIQSCTVRRWPAMQEDVTGSARRSSRASASGMASVPAVASSRMIARRRWWSR